MREIALIGFAQTLFFSLLVITKKGKESKDYLLTIFLLFVGAELIYRYLIQTISESDNKWLVFFDMSYWALFGPLTLLYIQFTINSVKKFKYKHILHLIPLIVSIYAFLPYLNGNIDYGSFIEYFNVSVGNTKTALLFWEFCSPIYLLYSIYILVHHKKSIKNYFSDIDKNNLKWLLILLLGFTSFLIISYVIMFFRTIFQITININSILVLPSILTVYVFFIGYHGYKQAGIFFEYPKENIKSMSKNHQNSSKKYEKSGMDESERLELLNNLTEIMNAEKPFIEFDLNINELAKKLGTTYHKLSQTINESFNKNFYNYINSLRIEESKKLLKQPDNQKYTIISIAYECGFSSKSSFYAAFKQNTGITPKEYLNQ